MHRSDRPIFPREKSRPSRYMDILQKQRHEFEDIMARRLREQENALVLQAQSALQEKEASIQSVLNTALDAQKQEFEEDMKAFEEVKTAELSLQLDDKYGKIMEDYKRKVAADLKQKVATLDKLTAKLKHVETALAASQTNQQGSLKAHRLSAAALARKSSFRLRASFFPHFSMRDLSLTVPPLLLTNYSPVERSFRKTGNEQACHNRSYRT